MSWPLRAIDCIFIIVGTEFLPVLLAAGGNFVMTWIPSTGRYAYDIVSVRYGFIPARVFKSSYEPLGECQIWRRVLV